LIEILLPLAFVQVILPSYSTIMLELSGLDPYGCNNLSQKHSANCLYICKYRKCHFEPSIWFGEQAKYFCVLLTVRLRYSNLFTSIEHVRNTISEEFGNDF